MTEDRPATRPRRWRTLVLAASLVGLTMLALGILLVHTAPVRGFVLQYASRLLLASGIRLEATRLDYNLATRRVALTGLRVSAVGDAPPFFEADEVSVHLSSRAFQGTLEVEDVVVVGGLVRIRRDADGHMNLPTSSGAGDEPQPLQFGHLRAPGLAFEFTDEARAISLRVPALTIDLEDEGQVVIDAPADVAVGTTTTRIANLESALAFDGRSIRFDRLHVATTEGRADLTGTLTLFVREPSLDLHVTGDVDLGLAARWGLTDPERLDGAVHVEADVRGPLAAVVADVELTSERLAWNRAVVTDVTAQARVDRDGMTIQQAQVVLADGRVSATGAAAWGGLVNVEVSWREVAAATLLAAFGSPVVVPSGLASGRATFNGPLDAPERWTVDALLDMLPGGTGRRRVSVPGRARLVIEEGRWRLEARHTLGGVMPLSAALEGELRTDEFGATTLGGIVRLAPTDLAAMAGVLTATGLASVPDDLATGDVSARITLGGTLDRPDIAIAVESDRLTVAEQRLANIRARGAVTPAALQIDEFSAEQPADISSGSGRLEGAGRYDLESEAYEATATVSAWQFLPTTEVPLSAVVDGTFAGSGRGRSATGGGRVVVGNLSWQDLALGDLTADIALEGEHARVEARLEALGVGAVGTIELVGPYQTSARITADALDLTRVRDLAGISSSVEGTASLRVDVDMPLADWRAGRAAVDLQTLEARDGTIVVSLSEPARLRYDNGRVLVDRFEAAAGGTSLSATGALLLSLDAGVATPEAVQLTLRGSLDEVIRTAALAGIAAASEIASSDGAVTVTARVTGAVTAPEVTADLNVGPASVQLRSDLPAITGLQVRAHLEDGQLQLTELLAAYQGARVAARGGAPLALLTAPGSEPADSGGGSAVLQARFFDVGASVLAPLLEPEVLDQIAGSLDATLDLSAPTLDADAVRADLVLERFDVSVAKLPVRQTVPTQLAVRDGVASVERWNWEGEGATLAVTGRVTLADRMADLQASGRLDLRMLTPLVREAGLALAGRLEPRVQLTGSLDDLVLTGGLDLSGGELRLADPAVVVSQLEARAALTRGQVAVSSLSGTINGGTLTGAGELRYAPGVGGRFTADVAGMALNFPEGLRSEVDADVALAVTTETGENLPDGRLSGTVTVTRSAYREPLALVTGLLGALRNSVATAAAQSDSVFLDRLALDVRVVTDDDLVIRNNVARAQIGADLRVIGTASAPSLSGRAELREGGQLFLGRNIYTVQSGTIDFANPVTIEPNLGIVAGTRAGGEDIEIRIAGTPETLSTTLSSSSDPDLGQADITSLLLTGRRMEDLGSGQAAAVGAQVLGNVSGDVLGFAGRAIGLDTLRVGGVESSATRRDAADLAAEVDPTSRLTFGKSLGSNIDITLSQSLQQGDAQTWIIDYLPARQVALRLVSDDDDLRSYAFRHDLVFGAVPARLRSGSGPRAAPPRVSAIHLDGDLGFPREQILSRLRLTVGDRFDFVAWQDDRDRLERFYRTHRRLAARIGADRQESSDGTALTYAITAGPETAVVVRGATLSTRAVEEIETAWAESVFDGFLVEETEGIVRRELARGGYLQPSVQVALTDAGATRTLEVRVEPGAETRRTDVRLEGVDGPLRADLTEAATGLASGGQGVTAPRILGDGLVDYLRARGYPDATATVGAPVFDGVEVFVPVTVVTGPLFSLGVITVEGGSALDMDVLLGAVGLTTGDPHVPAAVAAARARLQGRYRLEGFSTASIQVRQQTQPAESSIDVAFVATEGPRQVVGELVITGNSSIEDSVVTRALRLPVGEPLRPADWLNARQRLFETGLFRRVDIALEPTSESDPETPATVVPMRVRVLLEEWPGLRLRYGFQVAEERPEEDVNGRDLVPGVTADLTRRTLFRRAITIGGAAQYERRERLGRLFLNTPTLWGLPLQSSVVLERSRREFRAETLVTDRTSASWEQRVRRGGLSLSYSLRFERNHTFDTEPQVNSFFPAFDETVNVARLTGSAAWDTRDDPADTTAGTLLSSTIEHASETLGSDVRFVRSLSQAYHFRTVGGVVLASAGRFGMVRPLGGQAVIPSQRFFAGGARTVRGVREDGLGGYDFLGAPLGGTTMLVFNQEVRFPVYRWIRGVVFLDAGGVGDLGDVAVSRLTGSGGIGLRVSTPFAVLRLDYGKTLWRGSSDDDGQWIFGIGHTF